MRLSRKTDEEIALKVGEGVAVGAGIRVVSMILAASAASAAIAVVSTSSGSKPALPALGVSAKGAAFITRHEGVRYYPYQDPSGIPACTVGVGHVIDWHYCTPTQLRTRYTPTQVLALLLHDSGGAARCVNNLDVLLNQAQFDALVDLTFNAGCGSLDYRSVKYELQHHDFAAVPASIRDTATTAGSTVPLAGLVARRKDEATLFATWYYGPGIGYFYPLPAGYWCKHYKYKWSTCVANLWAG